jgi:hypothetical protein
VENHFSQLWNIHGVNYVRRTEIHPAEPIVPEPSAFEAQMAEKMKRHKSPGIDQSPTELIKARGRTIRSETHKCISCIGNKEELPEEWKESIIVLIYKKGIKQIVAIIEAFHFCQLHTKFYPTYPWQG